MQKREFLLLLKKENQFGKINKMDETKDILTKYKNIALVGASKDLNKTSTIVMKYLQNYGYKVYPVNPKIIGQVILGERVYGKVSEIDGLVDIVNVFRPSDEAVEIVSDAIKINAKVLWLQLNIKNSEAKKIANENNIIYIEDKCTKIEFEKHFN